MATLIDTFNKIFNIISGNLPFTFAFIVFFIVFFIIFISFIVGIFMAFFQEEEREHGRKVILRSLYVFFIFFIVVLIFTLSIYFIKKEKSPLSVSEFPPAPFSDFPPPPEFINIGGVYFGAVKILKEVEKKGIFETTKIIGLYAILCRKDGSDDIIYVGTLGKGKTEKESNYKCWLEKCGNEEKNLYITGLIFPEKQFNRNQVTELNKKINSKINPPCFVADN